METPISKDSWLWRQLVYELWDLNFLLSPLAIPECSLILKFPSNKLQPSKSAPTPLWFCQVSQLLAVSWEALQWVSCPQTAFLPEICRPAWDLQVPFRLEANTPHWYLASCQPASRQPASPQQPSHQLDHHRPTWVSLLLPTSTSVDPGQPVHPKSNTRPSWNRRRNNQGEKDWLHWLKAMWFSQY